MGPWLSSLEDILGSNWKVAASTSSYGTERLLLASEMFLIDPFLHAPPPCVLSPIIVLPPSPAIYQLTFAICDGPSLPSQGVVVEP